LPRADAFLPASRETNVAQLGREVSDVFEPVCLDCDNFGGGYFLGDLGGLARTASIADNRERDWDVQFEPRGDMRFDGNPHFLWLDLS
jgi:hypothetical protein